MFFDGYCKGDSAIEIEDNGWSWKGRWWQSWSYTSIGKSAIHTVCLHSFTKSLLWKLFNHLPIMFWLNLYKRFHISGPHTLYSGYRQQVICIVSLSNLNTVLVFDLPICLTHIILSTPVKVDELDLAICIEKKIGLSQITKDISLIVQLG